MKRMGENQRDLRKREDDNEWIQWLLDKYVDFFLIESFARSFL